MAASASLWTHAINDENGDEELLLSGALLEELQLQPGDYVEIKPAESSASPPQLVTPPAPSGGEHALVLRVPATPAPSKSALQISIQRPVADALSLSNRQAVRLRHVRAEDVALDWAELVFKEQYMSRGDIWHFKQHLLKNTPALYVGKVCHEDGLRAHVKGMVRRGAPVDSGVLNADTVLSFRSRCASFVLLIQMSDEMWGFAPDGELYHEKAPPDLPPRLRRRPRLTRDPAAPCLPARAGDHVPARTLQAMGRAGRLSLTHAGALFTLLCQRREQRRRRRWWRRWQRRRLPAGGAGGAGRRCAGSDA
jgi:hypothetical protein